MKIDYFASNQFARHNLSQRPPTSINTHNYYIDKSESASGIRNHRRPTELMGWLQTF